MGAIDAKDEALAMLRSAIGTWATTARGVLALRRREARRAALATMLRACRDPAERARLSRELEIAEESVKRARRAHAQAARVVEDLRTIERRFGATIESKTSAAQADLQRRLAALAGYREAGMTGSSPSSTNQSSPVASAAQAFAGHGLVDVPLDNARFDDNPIVDGYHKGGAKRADYRWAVETWETTVRPGVLAGQTREDFERRDASREAPEFRRTANVYDMFLGDDPVHFSRRSDGSLDVASGRHRVETARSLGLTHLPGKLS
jgi:hypothetical protein